MSKFLISTLILSCVNFFAHSNGLDSLKHISVDDALIYHKKDIEDIALSKTEVDSLQLAQTSTNSLANVISRFTPAFIKSYGMGSTATISFRGTAASHTQVEWNGINVNNPMLGQVDFSLIPVWFIDNVELYHGGSSMQLGSGSLGGTVSIGSMPRWDKPLYGSIMQSIGSFSNYQTFLSAGGGDDKIQANIKYFYEQAENDFEFRNVAIPPFELVKQKNANYKKNGIQADVNYHTGEGDFISLNLWYHFADRSLPVIMSYEGLGRDETQQDNDVRGVVKWSRYRERFKSNLVAGVSFFDIDYRLANKTNTVTVVNSISYSKIISYSSKYNIDYQLSKKILFRGGVNGAYHQVKSHESLKNEGYEKSRVEMGVWGAIYYQISERFMTFALVREDFIENTFSPIMPSVGLNYALLDNNNLNFKFNMSRNYHAPTLNDLYWLPGGNPDLRPERGYSGDIGVDYELRSKRWSGVVACTGFASLIDDWIVWQPSEYRYWTAKNIKQVFARGIESSIKTHYNSANGKFGVSLYGNYGFTKTTNQTEKGEFDNSVGKQLIYIPVHKANVFAEVKYCGFYANYNWSYVSERFTTSSNEAIRHKLPAYYLSDIVVGKRFSIAKKYDVNIELKANNIFGVDYQAILWRAMPKQNYQAVIRLDF